MIWLRHELANAIITRKGRIAANYKFNPSAQRIPQLFIIHQQRGFIIHYSDSCRIAAAQTVAATAGASGRPAFCGREI